MAFHGLFVGIDRYASPAISWLSCARRDAVALHALCADTFGAGGSLLVDEAATRQAIKQEFESLARCQPEDVVFIAFSGHGSRTHELVTYDANKNDLSATSISLPLLTEWFSRIPAKRLVCILDCCFSGGMGSKVLQADVLPRDLESTAAVLERLSGEGRLILTASSATEPAWEATKHGHGLLTYHLLHALQGVNEVVRADRIPVYQLLDYVTKRVVDSAAQFGKLQHPALRGQIDGDLVWPIFVAGTNYRIAFPERAKQVATADTASLSAFNFPPALVGAWAQSIPSLNALQLAAINEYGLLDGEHLTISAPTSSGKTMIGELAALKGLLERRRALFLLPLKALVNDKHRHFTGVYGPLGIRTIMATGDASPDIPDLIRGRYDICLLTYEKFGALILGYPHILEQVGTIVVDEVQMLADESRGANLEFILTLLRMKRQLGVEPQVVALSAVIGDTNGLERWLGTRLLRRDERPVPLNEGLLLASGRFRYIDAEGREQLTEPIIRPLYQKGTGQDWIIPLVRRLVTEGKQVIVFRETKGEARGCAKYLSDSLALPRATAALADLPTGDPSSASHDLQKVLSGGVAFHTADLDRDERLVIENHFRATGTPLRVIVATTTLAMGVNTPAEAVVIEGLEHPGPAPYSVAEYKNMVGRAGRLGFSTEGFSYLMAWDATREHHFWKTYVLGKPEDLQSRFVTKDTDPRSLLLRVLVGAQHARIPGVPIDDALDFLQGSFGAFQQMHGNPNWKWDRQQLMQAFRDLERHQLITSNPDGLYHLTDLGRFTGESGVQVESVVRIVDALAGLGAESISDPTLIVAAQLAVELDDVLFPINTRSTQKEPQAWAPELRRQGVPQTVVTALSRSVTNQHQGTLRAKKAVACLLWISGQPMEQMERTLTQFGGAFGGAAGPIRAVSSRTADLLPVAARVAEVLHQDLRLGDRLSRLLVRLEYGTPSTGVSLAAHAGNNLSRGDYQLLLRSGLHAIEAIESAKDETILACVGGDQRKLAVVRAAAKEFRRQQAIADQATVPILPPYEQ